MQQWRPRAGVGTERHQAAGSDESADGSTPPAEPAARAESSQDGMRELENGEVEDTAVGHQDWEWSDSWYGSGWNGRWWNEPWNWSSGYWDDNSWGDRRGSNVSRVEETTMVRDGKWLGAQGHSSQGTGSTWGEEGAHEDSGRPGGNRSNEKLVVPEFTGEGSESELGRSARSYLRKVAAWLKCTRMAEKDRAVALYTNLGGKAWVFAEELDVDLLARPGGVDYFQDWIRVRFMEMEVTKVSNVMSELFRRCRRKPEQTVRDFNVEFERLVLHLKELNCELPGLVKAWLYLDKLKLNEGEELALLSSVHNQYDVKLLQQAAILHDRGPKRTWEKGNPRWGGRNHGGGGYGEPKSVHVTNAADLMSEDEMEPEDNDPEPSDSELVSENVAENYHCAFMAFQDAKSKYREAMKGRGVDAGELKRRSEERLKAAKAKSFCAACKRRGHWHRDPECPLRGKASTSSASMGDGNPKNVQVCNHVQMCYMTGGGASGYNSANDIPTITDQEGHVDSVFTGGTSRMLAITDTACTKAVAGHLWFEQYCQVADRYGWEVEIIEERDRFKFGASRIHESHFAVNAVFAIEGQPFKAKIAIVQCDVPLLFSKTILVFLGMTYDVVGQKADLRNLDLREVPMETSPTGHPALIVSDYPSDIRQQLAKEWTSDERVQFPILDAVDPSAAESAYKERDLDRQGNSFSSKPLFYPKKLALEVENMLKSPSLSKVSFYTWWQTANQSRDFWIENADMIIRVHVVPRKFPFDPRAWKTPLHHLKDQLLDMLGEVRYTEVIPCHAEGLHELRHEGAWRSENWNDMVDDVKDMFGNLWIGRSCFKKRLVKHDNEPSIAHACAVVARAGVTMEDAPGRADCRAGDVPSSGTSPMDGAGDSAIADRATGDQVPEGRVESSDGAHKVEVGRAAGQGGGVAARGATKADEGSASQVDQGGSAAAGRPCDDVWQVPQLALQGSAGGLHGLECPGGESQFECLPGSEALCKVGTGRTGRASGPGEEERHGAGHGRPGGESCGGTAGCGVRGVMEVIGEPGVEQEVSRERQAAAGRGARGTLIDAVGVERGGPGGTGRSGDEAGCSEAETSPSSSWISTMIQRAKGWINGAAGEAALKDIDIVAENDKVVGLSKFVDEEVDENDMAIGLGSGTKYEEVPEETFVIEVEHESGSDGEQTDGQTMTPRQKAVAGIRKRREAKKPIRKKLIAMGRKLHQVLLASAFVVGSMANECILEPGINLMTGHGRGADGGDGADFLEIFAGSAKLSGAFAAARRGVLRPVDLVFGDDLRQESAQQELYGTIEEEKPELIWMAPPCTDWCGFSRLNFSKQELRRRRKKQKVLLQVMNEVLIKQLAAGRDVVIENPMTSDIWSDPSLAPWCADPNMCFFRTDLCQFGMKSVDGQYSLRKPIKLLATNPIYEEKLKIRCCDEHEHKTIQGKETGHSAEYPIGFAKAVEAASRIAAQRKTQQVFAVETGDAVAEMDGEVAEEESELIPALEDFTPSGAADITFKGTIGGAVAGALKRLHQNLGHPSQRELVRHLRLSGAPAEMVEGAGKLVCKTCASCAQPKAHRVAKPAALLDFNEAVALDIIFLDTLESTGIPALNMVDLASTYQVVVPIENRKSETVAQAFYRHWISWAGVPGRLVLDLDTAFQDSFWELTSDHSISMRSAAGQAHWQNGIAERFGQSWKDVWRKVCKHQGVGDKDLHDAAGAVSEARNSLRNRSGFSPRQWVFGTNGKTMTSLEDDEDWSALSAVTTDMKMARKHNLKMAARAAFFETQNVRSITKALSHRARVKPRDYKPGDMVYIYRDDPSNKKHKAKWIGPATIIGAEGSNYWAARGGRCLLAAGEHLRPAEHEEVSLALRIRAAIKEVEQALNNEFAEVADGPDEMMVDGEEPPVSSIQDVPEVASSSNMEIDRGGRRRKAEQIEQQHKVLKKQARLLDDVPLTVKQGPAGRATQHFYTKSGLSGEALEKALDKELPWNMIPFEEKELYQEAELKQWKEHVDFGAVRPLSVEESRLVESTIGKERILPARFLYRDKNRSKRRQDGSIPCKPKARLCVGGQKDPDLGHVEMSVDAPTASRHAVLLGLLLALARGWMVTVGDIRAAFLNGVEAPRGLYFRQPVRGIPTLEKGQLIEILKGVFGLATSPKLWWLKLSNDLLQLRLEVGGEAYVVEQNEIDPCAFRIRRVSDRYICGMIFTHVDDLLVMAAPEIFQEVKDKLSERFPIDEWEQNNFEYVGCEYKVTAREIRITQTSYTQTRVEKIPIPSGLQDDDEASADLILRHRSVVGALSWLAKQTRPDLQYSVAQAQRVQNKPTIGDLRNTNKLVDLAKKHFDKGIVLRRIPEEHMAIFAFHDAAWGNVDVSEVRDADPRWEGDHPLGSQLGTLVMVGDNRCMENQVFPSCIVDWRSKASTRVCRSTFAGETMACGDALETALFLRGLLVSFRDGDMLSEQKAGERLPMHLFTDCKSLYDHLHREGVPRPPSEKRLAIELAAIRQALMIEGRHQWKEKHGKGEIRPDRPLKVPIHWLPTDKQWADILTKKMTSTLWWQSIGEALLSFPFTVPSQSSKHEDARPV